MDPKEIIQKANEAWKAATDIATAHRVDGKWATVEAKANYDAAMNVALDLKKEADGAVEESERTAKARDMEAWLKESAGTLAGMSGSGEPAPDVEAKAGGSGRAQVQFKSYHGDDAKVFHPQGTRGFKAADEVAYTDVMREWLARRLPLDLPLESREGQLAQAKALSMGIDASGGALVASEVVLNTMIEALEDAVLMRRLGNVLPPLTTAASIRVGTAGDTDDATWTSELLTGSEDTSAPFGARALTPHPLAKRVKISNTLLRLSGIDIEAWVRNEGTNRFAEAEENGFMTGSGAQQPLGLFTSSLPTTYTCVSSTDIARSDLVRATWTLKQQYRARASWIFHRTILLELNLLVDGIGRPLLREVPGAGTAFSIEGYPVNESEYAPSSSATGLAVGALGDWKRAYWIVDSLNLTVQRLDQLYAETNQTGYIFRKETDGMVVDGNGVVKMVMA